MSEFTPTGIGRQGTLREFVAVVFRRKWLILGLFMVTTGTIAVMAAMRQPVYQSTGRVLVKRGERESLLEGGRRYLQWEEDLASEVQVIESPAVVQRAQTILDEEAGGASALRLVAKQVGAEVVGESNVILIAYQDGDRAVAHKAADALVRAYIDYRNQTYTLAYPAEFFRTELKRVSDQLAKATEERRQFTASEILLEPAYQGSSLLAQRQSLRQQLTELESDLAAQRSTLATLQRLSADPNNESALPTGEATLSDGVVAGLKTQIVAQQTRLAQLRERYLDESNEVRSVRQTLDTLRGMLSREIRARLEGVEAQAGATEARRKVVLTEVQGVEARIAALPSQESRLGELDRRIAVLKESYAELSRRSDQARIAQATSSNITVLLLSPAGAAVSVNARDYVRLALAPVFSLMVGLALAFFLDSLDTTVRNATEAEQALEVPVLASLAERRRRA